MPSDMRLHSGAIALGGVALAAALGCIALSPRAALTGWLGAAVLLVSVPLPSLLLLAMMQLIRGEWEADLRAACEAGARLWPLAAAAFVPVLLGMGSIYGREGTGAGSGFRGAWLGAIPFVLRSIGWFAGTGLAARVLVGRRVSEGAAAAIVAFLVIGGSLVAVDWLMSLDPAFHSSAFGLQMLSLWTCTGAGLLCAAAILARPGVARSGVLGGLLLTLLLLWAYFAFLPFLVIWSGNLPDGVAWYQRRLSGGWSAAAWAWAILGVMPLLALFFPHVRRGPRPLAAAAIAALCGKVVEFAWFALPGQGMVALLAYALASAGFAILVAAWMARCLGRERAP